MQKTFKIPQVLKDVLIGSEFQLHFSLFSLTHSLSCVSCQSTEYNYAQNAI